MFAAQIIHDPENAVAKTLEQAILKLDALNKMGNAQARWGQVKVGAGLLRRQKVVVCRASSKLSSEK